MYTLCDHDTIISIIALLRILNTCTKNIFTQSAILFKDFPFVF